MPNAAFSNAHPFWLTGIVLMTLVNLAGCNGIDKAHWTEEVKLHDGRMIVVERTARARHSGFPNASRGQDIDYDLKYAPMKLNWHGNGDRSPVAFEIFNGIAYLVLYTGDHEFCVNRDPKRYLAQFLRWRNGAWIEVEQSKFPTDLALMNLYQGYWGHDADHDAKGLITWITKATEDKFYPEHPDTIKIWFESQSQTCDSYQHDALGARN